MKKYLINFSVIICLIQSSFASDRHEDVQQAYKNAMENGQTTCYEREFWDYDEESESQAILSCQEEAVVRLKNLLPLAHVTTTEQIHAEQADINSGLFHAFNAGISIIEDYLYQGLNDRTYEWTYLHSFLIDKDGNKLALDGVRLCDFDENDKLLVITNSQLYEIQRQKISLELKNLWVLLVFWKKNVFPDDRFQNYSALNATALSGQINTLFNMRNNALENLPSQLKDKNLYAFTILEILQNINQHFPKNFYSYINISKNMKRNTRKMTAKIAAKDEEVTRRTNLYTRTFDAYMQQVRITDMFFNHLIESPFTAARDPRFFKQFKKYYNNLMQYEFPASGNSRMRFSYSILEFDKLMPSLEHFSIPLLTASDNASTPSLLPEDAPETETSNVDEGTIVYDHTDWKADHQRYQAEKAKQKSAIEVSSSSVLTDYERKLFSYLQDNIFCINTKLKSRHLIADLAKLHFKTGVNRKGKGSVHYVSPTPANPLFGKDPYYSEAYFNLHLPTDGDLIPYDYFRYLQSGFENVFGLSKDHIVNSLAH